MTPLSDEELDQAVDGFNALEVRWGWKEAVRMMLAFRPLPERIWQIKDRANERAAMARDAGDTDTERRHLRTAESLSILGKKAEKLAPVDWSRPG